MGCRLWGRTELDTTEATQQQQQQRRRGRQKGVPCRQFCVMLCNFAKWVKARFWLILLLVHQGSKGLATLSL